MSTLLLRLAGPMQSWGTQSRFTIRDTGLEPSKSGVIGLLCAAIGRPRSGPIDDLVEGLRMGVRVDRDGIPRVDFQTAGGTRGNDEDDYGVPTADGSSKRTVTSQRHYLADADFLVGLEGDNTLLRRLQASLARPKWPLYLGRKGYAPGTPLLASARPDKIPGPADAPALTDLPLEEALGDYPWFARTGREKARVLRDLDRTGGSRPLRLVLDAPYGSSPDVRCDVPLSFDPDRRRIGDAFTLRCVRTDWAKLTPEMVMEVGECISQG